MKRLLSLLAFFFASVAVAQVLRGVVSTSGGSLPDPPAPYWQYVAADDGLDNGTGCGDWTAFNSATLNADPASDTYLEITAGASAFGGVSTNCATPTFAEGTAYDVTLVVAGGTNATVNASINGGTAIEFDGTGSVNDTITAGGTTNFVLLWGDASMGETYQITSITIEPIDNVLSFTQSTRTVQDDGGNFFLEVDLAVPQAADAISAPFSCPDGCTAACTLVTSSPLTWSEGESGSKFIEITPTDVGLDDTCQIDLGSPTGAVLGSITSQVVTVEDAAATASTDYRWGFGGYKISNSGVMTNATYLTAFARRYHWVVHQAYSGVDSVYSAAGLGSLNEAMGDLKAINSDQIELMYTVTTEIPTTWDQYSFISGDNWGDGEDGLARTGSNQTINAFGTTLLLDCSNNGREESANNDIPCAWLMRQYLTPGGMGIYGSNFDGVLMDNAWAESLYNYDQDNDGDTDQKIDPTYRTLFREGIILARDVVEAEDPGAYVLANGLSIWYSQTGNGGPLSEYEGEFHGGIFERDMGAGTGAFGYSFCTSSSTHNLLLTRDWNGTVIGNCAGGDYGEKRKGYGNWNNFLARVGYVEGTGPDSPGYATPTFRSNVVSGPMPCEAGIDAEFDEWLRATHTATRVATNASYDYAPTHSPGDDTYGYPMPLTDEIVYEIVYGVGYTQDAKPGKITFLEEGRQTAADNNGVWARIGQDASDRDVIFIFNPYENGAATFTLPSPSGSWYRLDSATLAATSIAGDADFCGNAAVNDGSVVGSTIDLEALDGAILIDAPSDPW